jgi:hypothetical protein
VLKITFYKRGKKIIKKTFGDKSIFLTFATAIAEIAQLVERDLAKVEGRGSESRFPLKRCPGGGMVDALVSGASV